MPLALESNYAREHRNEVAALASIGYISVIAPDGLSFTRHWYITRPGLMALQHHEEHKR